MPRAICILFVVMLVWGAGASAQISPGPLSNAHSELDGMRQCRSCHGGGDDKADGKCLECHQAVAMLLEQDRGLHALEGRGECAKCHPEHAGRDFDLVDWGDEGRESFDHARTGWAMEGAHRSVKCDKCHNPERQQRNVMLRRPDGANGDSFLGLDSSSCPSCHVSPHTQRLAQDCTGCHGVNKWNAVPNFDHAKTAYALAGKHAGLECGACHKNGRFGRTESSKSGLHYAPIAFDECSSCHKDPHAGRFGAGCADCHVTTDFRNVPKDRFEHARTRFPLRGAHAKVGCARCHDPAQGGWGPKPVFDLCSSCHSDAHAGTATLAGAVVDCDKCHGQGAFTPATFDVAMHARTKYPLGGRHADLACAKCHTRDRTDTGVVRLGKAAVELRPASAACRDCHADDHAGQLADRSDGGACESCHSEKGWKPSSFGVSQHARTVFALAGAHVTAECAKCHGVDRAGLRPHDPAVDPGKAAIVLSLTERLCSDCHLDVHEGRYLSTGKAAELGPCEVCHSQDRFVPSRVSSSDHDKYPFRLEGAHRATPCFLCHKELDSTSHLPTGTHALVAAPGPPDVVLWKLATDCQSCHRTEVPR